MFAQVLPEGLYPIILASEDFNVTLAAASSSGTATLSRSYPRALSAHFFRGNTCTSITTDNSSALPRAEHTADDTITVTRGTSSNDITAYGTVYQFNSLFVKSVQRGTVTVSAATSNTATISSVTTANSVVYLTGYSTASDAPTQYACDVTLTDATTVTVTKNTSISSVVAAFVVIEFQPWVIERIQDVSVTIAAASSSNTATITSIDTARSLTFDRGATVSSDRTDIFAYGTLTNSTTYTATRGGTTGSTVDKASIVTFRPGIVKTKDEGLLTIASSGTVANDTITAMDSAKVIISMLGVTSATGVVNANDAYLYIAQTSATNVRATRSNTGTPSMLTYYEAMRFL